MTSRSPTRSYTCKYGRRKIKPKRCLKNPRKSASKTSRSPSKKKCKYGRSRSNPKKCLKYPRRSASKSKSRSRGERVTFTANGKKVSFTRKKKTRGSLRNVPPALAERATATRQFYRELAAEGRTPPKITSAIAKNGINAILNS